LILLKAFIMIFE